MLLLLGLASLLITLCIYRFWEPTRRCASKADLTGRTVIVTGAATGIGYEVTKDLAKRGARVIMGCIDVHEAEIAAAEIGRVSRNADISVIHLDLACFDSVRSFAAQVLQREETIYALVNNAGLTLFKHVETVDGLDTVMQVNFFSPYLLTVSLAGRLWGRVVFVSSVAHKISGRLDPSLLGGKAYNMFKQYGNSKLCQIYFCQFMAKRAPRNPTFNCVHPGTVNTNFFENFPLPFLAKCLASIFGRTPEDGAQSVIYATVDESLNDVSGRYLENCRLSTPSKYARDEQMEQRVVLAAESLTGVAI